MKNCDISKFRSLVGNTVDVGWHTIKSGCLPTTALVIANMNKVTFTSLVSVIIDNLIVALVIANMNKVTSTILVSR